MSKTYKNIEELEGKVLSYRDRIVVGLLDYEVLYDYDGNGMIYYFLNRKNHYVYIGDNLKILNLQIFIKKHIGYFTDFGSSNIIRTHSLKDLTKIVIELFKLNEKVNA